MARHTEAFAARLRELKDRSGRSYGALAQRLHTSTSTLHRYCNGTTIPAEFAPAERFARACGATPEEVLALHRLWLLADAERRADGGVGAGGETTTANDSEAIADATTTDRSAIGGGIATDAGSDSDSDNGSDSDQNHSPIAPVIISPGTDTAATSSRWLKPTVAGLAAAAVLVPLAVYATRDSKSPTSAAAPKTTTTAATSSPAPSVSTPAPLPTPVTVNVLADNWDTECGQWFYATQPPSKVPPPPGLPDVNLWAQPLGAIPGAHLRLQLTAQGTPGRSPVVLHTLYVHIVGSKPAPQGGYAYTMGSGCGGGLDPASFGVDLDAAAPKVKAVAGQTTGENVGIVDFPFQVSGSDSQVLDVDAHSGDREIDWDLVLVWSCGDQQGTLTVDDHGKPFRTIGLTGKPAYFHDGAKWSPTPLDP